MEISSPRKIKTPPVVLINKGLFEYTDIELNVTLTKSIITVSMGQIGSNTSILVPHHPSGEKVRTFAGMQALIKSCVDNAEDIKNRIHQIVLSKSQPKSEEERVLIMKMDFMAVKQWFLDDIRKSKTYKDFSKYNSTVKLKMFSRGFNTFILDRNKYTHGQLCFLIPNYEYILEYIETPEQIKLYAYIDTEILKSYNSSYKEILSVIMEYNLIHQQLK